MSILSTTLKVAASAVASVVAIGAVATYVGLKELKKRQAASLTAYHDSVRADLADLKAQFDVAKAAGNEAEMIRIKGEIDIIEISVSIGNAAATHAVGCPPLETLKSELANMRVNRREAIREGDLRLVESIELHIEMHELLIKGHPESVVA